MAMRLRILIALGVTAAAAALVPTATHRRVAPRHHAFRLPAGALALRAVRSGGGPVVLFLHGFGESLISWRSVFDATTRYADAIAVDLPGFGLSAKPATGYATDSVAAVVRRALDTLGIRDAVIVGHSLGGAVAVAVALAEPERVRGLILVAPAIVGTAWSDWPRDGDSAAADAVRGLVGRYEALRTRFTAPHDPAWLLEDDTGLARDLASDSAYRASLHAVLREFQFAYLTADRAAALRPPVLLIWGRFDPVVPLALGRRLQDELPGSQLLVIDRSWHRPHLERPAAVAEAIRLFVLGLGAIGDAAPH
jgi:pimeloyl-ACP methyl ester carboxylesterase